MEDNRIELFRGQIGSYFGKHGADVTAKSAQGLFKQLAPAWDLVMQRKRGGLSHAAYEGLYQIQLTEGPARAAAQKIYFETLQRGQNVLVLLCYCRMSKACHVDILIDWLCTSLPNCYKDGTKQNHIDPLFDGLI